MILSNILASLALVPGQQQIPSPAIVEIRFAIEDSEGTIARVDLPNNLFVLQSGEELKRLTINENTKYMKGGDPIRKEDALKPGAKVTVTHADGVASVVSVASSR